MSMQLTVLFLRVLLAFFFPCNLFRDTAVQVYHYEEGNLLT